MLDYRVERIVLVALGLFTGVMAIVGTIGLLSGAWSQGLPVDWPRVALRELRRPGPGPARLRRR
jgi:hypothetical protein